MSDDPPWRHRQHRSRAGIRHDDGPIPPDYARRIEAERWSAFWTVMILAGIFGVMIWAEAAGVLQ